MRFSYEFSVGSVRAREKSLLSSSDIEQLVSFKSTDEVIRFLNDKGYGEGKTVDDIITSHDKKVWDYLQSTAPDMGIFSPFLIQNDVHNLKVVLKGIMANRKYDDMFLTPYTIEPELIIDAAEHRAFHKLPEWLSKAADSAYEIIAHKGDARECDAVIDRAVMDEMLRKAERFHSEFLKEYIKTSVFYNNIKIAIRSSKTNVTSEFLAEALCDVQDFRKSSVISSAIKGEDYLIDELAKYSEYDCKNAIEQYKISPTSFERFVDDKLINLAKASCKRSSEGAEPLIGYYLGCEAEKKVIHIIASGIKTGSDKEIIRERLREIYG